MDPMGRAVAAKTKIDVKFIHLIKDSTIATTIAGTIGTKREGATPGVGIHLSHDQEDLQLVEGLWNDTVEFRDDGIDIAIFYRPRGAEEPVSYTG